MRADEVSGSRWILNQETLLASLVRAVYLVLLIGRNHPTLGEEYTDILPTTKRGSIRRRVGARDDTLIIDAAPFQQRLLALIFLLTPSLLTSNWIIRRLTPDSSSIRWTTIRQTLIEALGSPWARLLPELHMIVFLFGGRYLEIGKRLAGISYVRLLAHH